jgi:Cu2+-exporting ATPase
MTCCGSPAGLGKLSGCTPEEVLLASKALGGGLRQTILSVPAMRGAACINRIEKSLSAVEGVRTVRANLSLRRVAVTWTEAEKAPDLLEALGAAGYEAHIPGDVNGDQDHVQAHLVRALAVAGFCSMNIMLFAVSVWAGADEATRHAFQLVSAALALPAVIYSGSSFYASAWRALSEGRLNMDVPISAGVLLSFALSLYDALTNSAQAYFEAATSLLFVLLAGRLLDHMMRRRARSAVAGLARVMPQGADVVQDDGSIGHVALGDLHPGARILVPMGARVPTDGVMAKGRSEVDASMLSGESRYRPVAPGQKVRAGEINRGDPFEFVASAAPENSLLAEMSRLLAAAEAGRTRYRHIADRAAALYAPVVHSLSALAFVVWLHSSGNIHHALTIAIAVLVITCPCALGLAVPMVQVALARRLYDKGVLAIDGTAFERLAATDTIVFDKTGTLTTGEPTLIAEGFAIGNLAIAGSMAARSGHPFSRALAAARERASLKSIAFDSVREVPGLGVEARRRSDIFRLGKAAWAADGGLSPSDAVVLGCNGARIATFRFSETLRSGALPLVKALREDGFHICMASGDTPSAVRRIASELEISDLKADMLPGAKVDAIRRLQAAGRKVLMVGDGVNDAAALRAADVSMAPSSASDIGRSAADLVFLSQDLFAVKDAIAASRLAMTLIRQNFALAAFYNVVSLPLAFAGYVTPLMAALAMSTSSLLVVVNSLRLSTSPNLTRQRHGMTATRIAEMRA